MSRSRYFQTLSFLESSVLLQSTPKIKALRKWAADLGEHGSLSLVISLDIDADYLTAIVEALPLDVLVLRTAPSFSPSDANRDRVRKALTAEGAAGDGPTRVWEAQGLWEVDSAAKLARECGALIALDPLGSDPLDEAIDTLAEEIASGRAYLRLSGVGRARASFREHDLERIAQLVEELEEGWVVLGNAGAVKDARTLRKRLRAHS